MNVDKQIVIYSCNGILFSYEKKQTVVLIHAMIRMNLPDIVLNRRNWTQNEEDCMTLFI